MTTTVDDIPDLRQLQTFLAVVESRGFGAAARTLGISQPSVSQQMRRLEDRLGHRLFAREGGAATLTSDGEALVIFARAMFSVAEQVRSYFGQRQVGGRLRVGFNEDFARTALPSVLHIFARSYEDFELLIDCNFSSRDLFAQLDDGRLDLVVAKLPATHVRGELLWREQLCWIGRSGDMRFRSDPVPLVVASQPNVSREMMLKALAGAGRTWRIRFQSPSLSALEAAVHAGIGTAALMRGMALGRIAVLDDDCGLPPLPDVALCLDCRSEESEPAIAAFAALLREAVLQMSPHRATSSTEATVIEHDL